MHRKVRVLCFALPVLHLKGQIHFFYIFVQNYVYLFSLKTRVKARVWAGAGAALFSRILLYNTGSVYVFLLLHPFPIFDLLHVHCAVHLIIAYRWTAVYPNSSCLVTWLPMEKNSWYPNSSYLVTWLLMKKYSCYPYNLITDEEKQLLPI